MARFKFLPHMSDVFIEAYGSTLEEAFENAALAMFEVMTDTSKVEPSVEESVEADGFDKQSLLYNWLEKLLVLFETRMMLCSKFKIEKIEHEGEEYRLKAKVWGEEFDPGKHEQRVGVKAVTYHMMSIDEKDGRWVLRFILDI
ncbi:MAG: archease [Candidatus Bathyarchaeota archaeon B24]|nr:MAG: archease [Candidatus Bathyarchaeota archaeon B24]RLI25165.1 MAG: archease [Candidatus Bathyarchaeota archaeon]